MYTKDGVVPPTFGSGCRRTVMASPPSGSRPRARVIQVGTTQTCPRGRGRASASATRALKSVAQCCASWS
jgi:hypothetical protein